MTTQTKEQHKMARLLVEAIEAFRSYEPEMQAQSIIVFLLVASKPGINMKELERRTGLSKSAVSRNVLMFSERHWKKDPDTGRHLPGLNLLVTSTDPHDPRAKLVMPSAMGRRFFEKLTTSLTEGRAH